MTTALLTRAVAIDDRPSHDQADNTHALLDLAWVDVSGTPLEAGASTTADEELGKLLSQQWEDQYRNWVDYMQGQHPEATVDPWNDTLAEQLQMEANGRATGRLDQYEKRLRAFLQTEPTEDELVTWLADRAMTDAAVWARMDAADMRFRASKDFYDANPELNDKKYTIAPGGAAEPKCLEVAGQIYPTQDEAELALSSVFHFNCQHYVDVA